MDQLDHRLPHSFDLLGGSSAADFQFRALRGPLALGAFRPIPSIKITGSTMGVVVVADRAAVTAGALTATITSTLRSTNSIASGIIRAGSPPVVRRTSWTLSGSRYPTA